MTSWVILSQICTYIIHAPTAHPPQPLLCFPFMPIPLLSSPQTFPNLHCIPATLSPTLAMSPLPHLLHALTHTPAYPPQCWTPHAISPPDWHLFHTPAHPAQPVWYLLHILIHPHLFTQHLSYILVQPSWPNVVPLMSFQPCVVSPLHIPSLGSSHLPPCQSGTYKFRPASPLILLVESS